MSIKGRYKLIGASEPLRPFICYCYTYANRTSFLIFG